MPYPAHPSARDWPMLAALILLAGSLALFWPGVVSYDAVGQYVQATTGQYDDWHPPIMARLWSMLRPRQWGAAPMLILQMTPYWAGLGLIARAVGGRRAVGILAIGLFPPLLGWQGVIVKDSQLTAAMMLATGLTATWLLVPRERRALPMTIAGAIMAMLAIGYAVTVRANALFAVVPFTVLIGAPGRWRWSHAVAIAIGLAAVLALTPFLNHRLLGAVDSGVQRTIPLYDLAGIAVRANAPIGGLGPGQITQLNKGHCVKPLFWDPLGERPDCAAALGPLNRARPGQLYAALALAAVRHPVAYLEHRLAHWNSTQRWLVGARWPLAAPPANSEPNDQHLPGPPLRLTAWWMTTAAMLAATPICWPILWTLAAMVGLWTCRDASGRHQRVGRALFASATAQELSFLAISISSDLRYHIWPMVATAIGWIIVMKPTKRPRPHWPILIGGAMIVGSGLVARAVLPPAPAIYADLMR